MAFEILKRSEKTAVLLLSPETGRLPENMGELGRYVSGKSGGLGDVVAALCEGLNEQGIECHLAIINLKKRFQQESRLNEKEWREIRYQIDSDKIHLISSSIFSVLSSAYGGDPLLNAVEFQRQIVNHTIKDVLARNKGRLIIHSHDWMAGGAITAYAKSRGCPILHTIHNVHTGYTPLDMYLGVTIDELSPYLYLSQDHGRPRIDCQATAIKNADLINFVGKHFLHEIVEDYFLDRSIITPAIRQEVKIKNDHGATLCIINAPSPALYPENSPYLAKNYGPDDEISASKKVNLVEFQRRTGLIVNPDANLLYWPSRLDPVQKGIELLEDIALRFVIEHGDVQIAVVGNGVDRDPAHEEIMGRIACASGGKIAYQRFDEALSMLGYAAAGTVFGASLYEPCGQIDQLGNLYGAVAVNRDTGGYHDKIVEINIREDGDLEDKGNGFLFKDYDSGGLWYGLEQSVKFHRLPSAVKEKQLKRMMKETRDTYSLKSMIDQYIRAYERLNHSEPLA